MIVERFAPSPTGLLHLGHAFSAMSAFQNAQNGRFLLRIEDIDQPRCRPEFEQAIYDDLAWLGLVWEQPVLRQSQRMGAYAEALNKLHALGLTYPCSCNRSDINAALSATQEGAEFGPDGPIYPQTCKTNPIHPDRDLAIRLNMEAALDYLPEQISFEDLGDQQPKTTIPKTDLCDQIGDIVLARKDIGTSYHIAVVVDDAFQGVTHVTRGADMAGATFIHRILQLLLGLPEPIYRHHRLIRDADGKRLAKRDDARAIQTYRNDGLTPAEVLSL